MYLVFNTEDEATNRADAEGQRIGYAYWISGNGTRRLNSPRQTKKPLVGPAKWALDVSQYQLTDEEKSQTVESVVWPPLDPPID